MNARTPEGLGMIRHQQSLSIATIEPDADEPEWAFGETFLATIHTARETVVVCRTDQVPSYVQAHGPYTAYEVSHHLDPSHPGILKALSRAPARAGISLMPFSTFDRGWILVARADSRALEDAWEKDGIPVTPSGDPE